MKRLFLVATLFASAAFVPTTRSDIAYTMLSTPLEIFTDFVVRYDPVDIDGNGSVDFTFGAGISGVGLKTEDANRAIIQFTPPPDIGGPLQPLDLGYPIEANLTPLGAIDVEWFSGDITIVQVFSTGSLSAFPESGLRAPVGVEFTAADGIHYGYLDILAGKGFAGITLYGWAYETEPGVAISAGAIPEPACAALVGCGLLALLVTRRATGRHNK